MRALTCLIAVALFGWLAIYPLTRSHEQGYSQFERDQLTHLIEINSTPEPVVLHRLSDHGTGRKLAALYLSPLPNEFKRHPSYIKGQ